MGGCAGLLMLLLSARSSKPSVPTLFLRTEESSSTVAQGQEQLAQQEVFLLSHPANLAPFKDTIFFSPLKKIP